MPTFRGRRAERVLEATIRATPPGAAKPWRTQRALAHIFRLLDEGISEGDLLDHVQGCAEVVRRGIEEPRWWSVGNLFGPKTLEVWRAEVAQMREADARVAAQEAELARCTAEAHHEAAAPLPIENLALRRLTQGARAAYTSRWDSAVEEGMDDAAQN